MKVGTHMSERQVSTISLPIPSRSPFLGGKCLSLVLVLPKAIPETWPWLEVPSLGGYPGKPEWRSEGSERGWGETATGTRAYTHTPLLPSFFHFLVHRSCSWAKQGKSGFSLSLTILCSQERDPDWPTWTGVGRSQTFRSHSVCGGRARELTLCVDPLQYRPERISVLSKQPVKGRAGIPSVLFFFPFNDTYWMSPKHTV